MTGIIVKGIAGFYYVYVAGSGIYECKARGIFRKQGRKPLVGDRVRIDVLDRETHQGNLVELLPRTSELARPAAANIDQALLLFAAKTPDPNFVLLDRFLISMEREGIPCVIAFNKADLLTSEEAEKLRGMYMKCGSPVRLVSVREGRGVDELKSMLTGRTTVLAGPSGAGKSSFANAVQSAVRMETGEISRKLSRGKNTTRHAELIPVDEVSWLCDTPGFMALENSGIRKEELKNYYDEFLPYLGRCRFDGCVHISEPDCAVKAALEEGNIDPVRYGNYCLIYEDLKEAEQNRYR